MIKISRRKSGARTSLVLLSVLLFLLLFAPAASAATYGDINDDGKIDVNDVTLVMQHALGLITLTEAQQNVADVNGDGNINVNDVTLIMQHALGLIAEFPDVALSVAGVTAVNPKQVEVEFSRILRSDETSKMTAANFHVGLQASPLTDRLLGNTNDGSAVAVMEDGKTVLLTMGNGHKFASGTTTNRVVVRQALGLDSDHVITNLSFIDSSVPTLVSVHTDGPRSLVLTFSEPLDRAVLTVSNISLNDGAVPLNLANPVYIDSRREVRIDTFSDLSAGSYTLGISSGTNIRDYSGFSVPPVSKTFTHSPITTPPSVSVKSSTESTVTIEFSRAIDHNTLVNNSSVLFRHTYNTTANQVSGTSVSNPSEDRRTFVISFGSRLLPPGNTTVWMTYVSGTLDVNKTKDTWGNIIPPASFTVETVPDTTAPTATVKVVADSNRVVEIEYSKAVSGALTPGNYVLRKGTSTVSFSGPVRVSDTNRYRITADQEMQGVHTLTISNIRDTSPAQNPMGTQTFTFDVPDIIPPTVDGVVANHETLTSANTVFIYYSEAMGSSAVDLANYRLVTAGNITRALPSGTTITQTATTVRIALPKSLGEIATDYGTADFTQLFVGNVKDLAGNTVEEIKNYPIAVKTPFDPELDDGTVISRSQVSFLVSRHLQSVDKAKIKDNDGVAATLVSITNNADGTATVTATFAGTPYSTYIPATEEEVTVEAGALTDINGFVNSAGILDITIDKAPPVILSTSRTLDGSKITTIDIVYSEALYPASVSDSDYSVSGYSITEVQLVNGNTTVRLTVTGGTGTTTSVTQTGSIQDIASPRNTLGPQPAVAVPWSP